MKSNLLKPMLDKDYQVIKSGKGIYMYDTDGKRYIDACSGAVVCNLGHGLIEIANIAQAQMKNISFVYRSQFTTNEVELLAQKLTSKTQNLKYAFFVNSGSEAVEASIRLALQYWQEQKKSRKKLILSRSISYHGMTFGSLSVSGHPDRRKRFENNLFYNPSVTPVYPYRLKGENMDLEKYGEYCADCLVKEIHKLGEENIAAFIAEPIVGAAGGAIVPSDNYFKLVREICNDSNILFIADEVMTGIGRTGKWFALDHWGVEPDISVIGKGISAGFTPIAGILIRDEIVDNIKQKTNKLDIFGHTYSGNPQSASIALGVLNFIEKNNLIERVKSLEGIIQNKFNVLVKNSKYIGEARGKGLLWGIEFVKDKVNKDFFDPSLNVSNLFVEVAREYGIILYPAGSMTRHGIGDAVLIAPPFIISNSEIDELFEILGEVNERFEKLIEVKT